MSSLFPEIAPPEVKNEGYAQVAVERGVDKYPDGLTYAIPLSMEHLIPGSRVMVPLGRGNSETPGDDAWLIPTLNAHHTVGFLILILTVMRINWRLNNPTPDLPAGMAVYQHYLARVTQIFLYFLMIFYPLTGWAVSSTSTLNFPVFFFGLEIPRMFPPQSGESTFAYDLFSTMHEACWKIGAVLLTLHISGALWGQCIKKNHVLTRMWRDQG